VKIKVLKIELMKGKIYLDVPSIQAVLDTDKDILLVYLAGHLEPLSLEFRGLGSAATARERIVQAMEHWIAEE